MIPSAPIQFRYFVYKRCGPDWLLGWERFPYNVLTLVLEGEAHYCIDGEGYHALPGTMLFVPAGGTRQATTPGMVCAAFDFAAEPGTFSLPPFTRFTPTEEVEQLIREFQYEWLQQTDGQNLKCCGLFYLLLHALFHPKETSGTNRHVEAIQRYIVEHFDRPIPMEQLAGLVNLNPVYCGALFRRHEGITVAEYTNRIRVRRATALLEEGVYGIAEIAGMCGFGDVYYFSSTFKRIMGVSPGKYKAHPVFPR